MSRKKFWLSLAAFEIVFGLVVFAATRQYYISVPDRPVVLESIANTSLPANSGNITEADLAQFDLLVPSADASNDPVQISRLADEYFGNGQYDQALVYYERLLTFAPDNPDTLNNLGLTLHYLDRSPEALQRLHDAVTANPNHQRAWLTLGFVNSQMGNTEDARVALTNAIESGSDEAIRNSASEMLSRLP
jgi:tetratricopeptide (TPR) repeat protein